ncbi:hypothetical protein V1T75_09190 [Tenacibaculum sp. FZY0031]|uniref:hypothetical protein n=1 Tax=Tenacibaculum sp. FZY0031 TaxID=3116648 RepID=UPI002EB40355|nr:hypothetical protein [Tenacibaculum sp. FZY0031]
MKKLSFDISIFESISENSESKLIGGFTQSFSSSFIKEDETANNCLGGNCSAGCGASNNCLGTGGNGCCIPDHPSQ